MQEQWIEPRPSWATAWNWRGAENPRNPGNAKDPGHAAARRRGLVGLVVGLAVAAAIYYLWRPVPAYVVAGISVALFLLAVAAPRAYLKVAAGLDRFGHAVGLAVTWVLMTLLYYLLFLPVGLFLRARGRLAITKHPDRRLPSYWIPTEGKAWTAESYRKQF